LTVLVDTPVWSLALRRQPKNLKSKDHRIVGEWAELVRRRQAAIIGPIRQELLSGIREEAPFEELRRRLTPFLDTPLREEDFVTAARFFNQCRGQGIAPGAIDLLLCAVAHRSESAILSTDKDFDNYARYLPIRLHQIRPTRYH
jgi:predicted nucleic acid-binding protein